MTVASMTDCCRSGVIADHTVKFIVCFSNNMFTIQLLREMCNIHVLVRLSC